MIYLCASVVLYKIGIFVLVISEKFLKVLILVKLKVYKQQ
ncbi:hypothetical protein NIES4073_00210 (plasmid) [Kalymmatonema gypsitolerans NIES-4073]|nr:hypothetical protein NIES4073_00210 [Scytonema sp. NIES-4073]